MSRIYKKKKKTNTVSAILFVVIVLLIVLMINWVTDTMSYSHQKQSLDTIEQSITRATAQCYALEGQYPPGLDYLEKNYGLSLDRGNYVYHYRSLGANIMPEISVMILN